MLSPKPAKHNQALRKKKNMSKLTIMVENDDIRRVWNYILPEQHKSTSYSPIQSIPLLTKQNCSRNHLKKGKTKNQ